jgi:Kef-type K+ transport system membrane component KefB
MAPHRASVRGGDPAFGPVEASKQTMSHPLQLLLLLALVIAAAKAAGALANRVGQPAVFGEILIGLLMGPTLIDVLAWPPFAAPGGEAGASLGAVIGDLAEIGVLLLMFVAGLETDVQQMRRVGTVAFWSALGGVVFPLIGGAVTAVAFGLPLLWEGLFIGAILTATSVSISAQTLIELGALRTREGSTILGAAVIDDVMGIIVLSLVVAAASASASGLDIAQLGLVAVRIVVFFAIGIAAGRWFAPFLRWASGLNVSQALLAAVLLIAFLYSWAAEYLGAVAAITGSYLAGVLVAQTPFKKAVDEGVHPLTYSMFVPIFFVSIGLQANGRELGNSAWFTIALVAVAIVTKATGCSLFARVSGFTAAESMRVGAGMISRGEVGLIIAGYGLAHQIIGRDVYSASVVMVLVTTMVTPPLLRLTFPRRPALNVVVEETIAGPPEEADQAR